MTTDELIKEAMRLVAANKAEREKTAQAYGITQSK